MLNFSSSHFSGAFLRHLCRNGCFDQCYQKYSEKGFAARYEIHGARLSTSGIESLISRSLDLWLGHQAVELRCVVTTKLALDLGIDAFTITLDSFF